MPSDMPTSSSHAMVMLLFHGAVAVVVPFGVVVVLATGAAAGVHWSSCGCCHFHVAGLLLPAPLVIDHQVKHGMGTWVVAAVVRSPIEWGFPILLARQQQLQGVIAWLAAEHGGHDDDGKAP